MSQAAKIQQVAQPFLRLVLAAVFIQSGWDKLQHLDAFYAAAQNYKILTPTLTYFYSVALPWLEIMAGLYLLLGLFIRFAAGLSGALLLSFLIALGIALTRGDAIDCGCFVGGKSEPINWGLFIRDCCLLAGCIALLFFKTHRLSLDGWLKPAQPE